MAKPYLHRKFRQKDHIFPIKLSSLIKFKYAYEKKSAPEVRMLHTRIQFILLIIAISVIPTMIIDIDCDTTTKNNYIHQPGRPTSVLSALNDIERQHFKLPSNLQFLNQRPSKFDSGDDIRELQLNDLEKQNYFIKNRELSTTGAADDRMRHILSMHDAPSIAAAQSAKINAEPTKNKMLSHLIEYVSSINVKSAAKALDRLQSTNSTIARELIAKNPFVARSIKNSKQPRPALKLANQLMENFNYRKSVTSSPETSFLVKPGDYLVSKLTGRAATKPTPIIQQIVEDDNKSASYFDDLMTEQASISSAVNTPLQSNLPQANANTQQQAKSQVAKDSSTITTKASQWLFSDSDGLSIKKPNKMANKYLHDSFRGLLTLTQLPILGGQISTAPSVFERQSYLKMKQHQDRNSNSTNLSILSESQRRKAIDELYRYAYILGTSVRRKKKDPLTALASTTPINKITSSTSHHHQNQKSKQLSDYARDIKSLLSSKNLKFDLQSSKKAKPRGVMWEMATDPSLAVTVFHLLERASVALPLGNFLFI